MANLPLRFLAPAALSAALLAVQIQPAHAILPLCRPVSTSGYAQARGAMHLYYHEMFARAFAQLSRLARSGNLYAQNQVAIMYHRGLGVPRDYEAAAEWWRRAADRGQVTAQCNLGIMYMYGLGVGQDDVKAYLYLSAAAARGSKDARRKRDLLEAWRMSPNEVTRAQALSRNWSLDP